MGGGKHRRHTRAPFYGQMQCPDCNEVLVWTSIGGGAWGDYESACSCGGWNMAPHTFTVERFDEEEDR